MSGATENVNTNEEKIDIKSIKTPEELKLIAEEIKTEVETEVKAEEKALENTNIVDKDTLKKYAKISPTFYVMSLSGDTEHEIFRILNPQTGSVEERELNELEKHEIGVKEFKESKIRFHPTKYGTKTVVTETTDALFGRKHKIKNSVILTNVTTNQFGSAYKQARKNKNRMQKKSRKLARKK
jgi:hypothetical protein